MHVRKDHNVSVRVTLLLLCVGGGGSGGGDEALLPTTATTYNTDDEPFKAPARVIRHPVECVVQLGMIWNGIYEFNRLKEHRIGYYL